MRDGGARRVEGPKAIEAAEFILRDACGKVRGDWGIDDSGLAGINLRDEDGGERLALTVAPSGRTAICLTDREHRNRIMLDARPDGLACLTLLDQGSEDRLAPIPNEGSKNHITLQISRRNVARLEMGDPNKVLVSATREGHAGLSLGSGEFRERLGMGLLPDGHAALCFRDRDGTIRLRQDIGEEGFPSQVLADERGATRLAVGSIKDGGAGMTFRDQGGKDRMTFEVLPDGQPRLRVLTEDGRPLLQVPGRDAVAVPDLCWGP